MIDGIQRVRVTIADHLLGFMFLSVSHTLLRLTRSCQW